MTKNVTVFGGSGFVGRYIVRRLVAAGWTVTVAGRDPGAAAFLVKEAPEGQVRAMKGNILDNASVQSTLQDAACVVNCVGTFDIRGTNNFVAIQQEGATRIAKLAAEAGISRMVHLSSIGASEASESIYAQTKARGEAGVLTNVAEPVILRPSVIFGAEDQFFNRFAQMSKLAPVLPVVGAETRFQPVYVDDVAQAAAKAVSGEVKAGIYELGGPDVKSFGELMSLMLGQIERKRPVLDIPLPLARIMAFGMDSVERITGGLIPAQITPDQVRSLNADNVVSDDALQFSDLGITPTSLAEVLPEYLWRYTPSGTPPTPVPTSDRTST
ncbi:MAG: complex I NDUFA9 subunit family protein [Pseudomonadota bacterium]